MAIIKSIHDIQEIIINGVPYQLHSTPELLEERQITRINEMSATIRLGRRNSEKMIKALFPWHVSIRERKQQSFKDKQRAKQRSRK